MITIKAYEDTRQWNLNRGNIKFSIDLEVRMLEEEKSEFYVAHTKYVSESLNLEDRLNLVVEMVDALCDYYFVIIGTEFKATMNRLTIEEQTYFVTIKSTSQIIINSMEGLLRSIIGAKVDLGYCYDLVVEANNLKPNTKTDDKVDKGTEWVDPKHKIKEYLLELGVDEYI